jgi:hypothetical protein
MQARAFAAAGLSFGLVLLVSGAAADGVAPASSTNSLAVAVDSRVELIRIIFRFAGHPEYNRCRVSGYAQAVDAHFAAVREHPAVLLARRLRAKRGVSYDAPMSLAVHLKDTEGLELSVPLEPWPEGIDQRWPAAELREFLSLTRDFALQGNFAEFRQAQAALYLETTARARQLVSQQGHLEWFGGFFGERAGAQFHLVPALVNGPNCYGPHRRTGTNEEFYCVLGVWETDWHGLPVFGKPVLGTVAHEFCHSYVNPHVYGRTAELQPAGEKLYAKVSGQMRRQAYGNWQTMLHESIVRAAVVRYLAATVSADRAAAQAREEVGRGFLWMEELAALLKDYEAHRADYPTFESFMPRIITFFSETAEKLPAAAGK